MSGRNEVIRSSHEINSEIDLICSQLSTLHSEQASHIRELWRIQSEQSILNSRLRSLVYEAGVAREQDPRDRGVPSAGSVTEQVEEDEVEDEEEDEEARSDLDIQVGDLVKLHYALPPIPNRGRVIEIENGIAKIESTGGFITYTSTPNLSVIERPE